MYFYCIFPLNDSQLPNMCSSGRTRNVARQFPWKQLPVKRKVTESAELGPIDPDANWYAINLHLSQDSWQNGCEQSTEI